MIVIHSEVPLASETREEALSVLADMAVTSREEAGVIDYRVTTDIESPDVARIIEQYEDMAAVEAHETSDHLEAFQADIEPLMDGEPELYRFTVASKTEAPGP